LTDYLFITGPCTEDEYINVKYAVLSGTGCQSYCQCNVAGVDGGGGVFYSWTRLECSSGTLWNSVIGPGYCDYSYNVDCSG